MNKRNLIALAFAAVLPATQASAAPVPAHPGSLAPTLVEAVASWRYHDNCGWSGGRWVVDLGAGKIVACRPRRPDGDWRWRHEGNHEGWYDRRRSSWHYNKW